MPKKANAVSSDEGMKEVTKDDIQVNNADRRAYNAWTKKRMAEHPTGNPNLLDEASWTRINRR